MRLLPDYREMYYKMINATERAMNILIDAQRECEEIYLKNDDTPIVIAQINKKKS